MPILLYPVQRTSSSGNYAWRSLEVFRRGYLRGAQACFFLNRHHCLQIQIQKYREFHSFQLSYKLLYSDFSNCSPGSINKALKRNGRQLCWEEGFPWSFEDEHSQTILYVYPFSCLIPTDFSLELLISGLVIPLRFILITLGTPLRLDFRGNSNTW